MFAKFVTTYQINSWSSVPYGLSLRLLGKPAGSYEQSLISTSYHGTPEVTNFRRPDRTRISLALKPHMKRNEVDS